MNWGVLTERENQGWGQGQKYIGLSLKYIIQASFNFSSEAEKQLTDAGDGGWKQGEGLIQDRGEMSNTCDTRPHPHEGREHCG